MPKVTESLYSKVRHINDARKNLGWDYKGKILRKNTSNLIWLNPHMAEFGVYMERVINSWVDSIKVIKKQTNYLMPLDDDGIV